MVCSVHQKKIPPGIFLCVNKSTFLRGYPVLLPAQKWLKGVLCDDNRWGWWWERHHSSGHSQLAEAGMDSCGLGHVQEDFWACPTIKCAPAGQTKSLFLLLLFLPSNSFQSHHNPWRFLLFFSISSWATSTSRPSSSSFQSQPSTPGGAWGCSSVDLFLMGFHIRNAREIF